MKKIITLLTVAGLLFFVISCDNGKKKSQSDEDSADLDTVADIDETADESTDENGDTDVSDIEPDDGTPDVDDAPKDPCLPNPCKEPNRSVCTDDGLGGFTCSCDVLTCEIDGACYKDGDVNPVDTCTACNRDFSLTGWSVRPDGSECEAVMGTPGSGICRKGLCGGFGTCDARAYKQTAGYPCNYDSECAGRCYTFYDYAGEAGFAAASVCTSPCTEDEDCPGDMLCNYSNQYGYECMPQYTSTVIRPDPLMPLYKPCNKDADCEGGMCLAYGETKFCSKDCERNSGGGKDLLACGSCGECNDNGDELEFKYKYYCVPDGSGKTGGNCQSGMDCSSGACYENYCTAACGSILSPCPGGYECMADVYQEGVETCVDSARLNIADGFACSFDYQCTSGSCIEFPMGKYCSKHCETEACAAGDCVQIGDPNAETPEMVCAPLFMPGHSESGESCSFDWECTTGLECFDFGGNIKSCTKACEKDEDCTAGKCYEFDEETSLCVYDYQVGVKPDGYIPTFCYECKNECYPDYLFQMYYCSSECSADAGCFDIGGCAEGYCRHAYPGRSFTYGLCRFDDDCEKNTICKEGFCTSECSTSSECAGYGAVVPTGTQKTCKPCTTNQECQNVFYDMGQCVTDYDGNKYCVEDCTDDPTICPEGTECYYVNDTFKVCSPVSGTCSSGGTACSINDICIKGILENGWACREDAECKSGICEEGMCQEGTCSEDSDCGCNSLECTGGNCVMNLDGYKKEVEPNDVIADATVITASGYIAAYFNHSGNDRETDIFKVAVKKGQYLNVRTHPFCEIGADTYMRFLDSSGNLIGEWENDDIDGGGYYFSELLEYKAESDTDIYIEITQSQLTSWPQNVPYLLEVQMFTPVANNSCENAETLTEGSYDKSIKKAVNTAATASCSGGYGYGPELYYKVNVPAGNALTFRVTPESQEFDPELSILSGCGDIATVCLAGNSFGGWGEPEELIYLNSGETAQDYIVVLDTPMLPFDYDFNIQIDISPATPPANDKIAGAIAIKGEGTESGTTIAAENDYAPALGICDKADLDGLDVVYSIDLKAGEYMHIEVDSTFAAAIYLVASTDLNNCITGGGIFNYSTETDVLLYLIIDSTAPNAYGMFSIKYKTGTTGPCEGICDTAEHRACSDETNLCMCDTATGLLKPTDCNAFCVTENEALTGTCKSNDKGNGCVCDYNCTDTAKVAEVCSNGYPSNCTCAASDPCGWVGDGNCDVFCADFYPADHFDENALCTTE